MSVSVLAFLALVLFAPFAAVVYASVRPTIATTVVLLTSILYLPQIVSFDPPGLPPLDKNSVAALCALFGCCVTAWSKVRAARPGRGVDLFGAIFLAGTFATALTNTDALVYGATHLPALRFHDGFSEAVRSLLYAIIPFFLGRMLYRTMSDGGDLLGPFALFAVLYAPLVLLELRMSPQLHRWVYGFHQHDFSQTIREGGYRPMVFMPHGISLAMFLLTACLGAIVLYKAQRRAPFGLPAGAIAGLLFVVLLGCKSVGAAVYGLFGLPLLLIGSPRLVARVSRGLAILVLLYPLLRLTGDFPTRTLLDAAAKFSQDRAASLAFRFRNEDMLVQKADERRWFGWGGFGRNRIYNEWGKDDSITDGHWILIFGSYGIIGMIGMYGMLLYPCWMAQRRLSQIPHPAERVLVSGLSLVVAVNVVDLLPNGMYTGLPLFLSGALEGLSTGLAKGLPERRGQGAG